MRGCNGVRGTERGERVNLSTLSGDYLNESSPRKAMTQSTDDRLRIDAAQPCADQLRRPILGQTSGLEIITGDGTNGKIFRLLPGECGPKLLAVSQRQAYKHLTSRRMVVEIAIRE